MHKYMRNNTCPFESKKNDFAYYEMKKLLLGINEDDDESCLKNAKHRQE